MDTSSKVVAALALNRFGMGPRLGSIAAIAADPRGAVLADLDRPRAGELVAPGLPSSGQAFQRSPTPMPSGAPARSPWPRREEAKGPAEPSMREGGEATANATAAKMAAEAVPNPGRQIYLNEAKARIDAALGSEIGFVERLVWFWSNHFCISADKIRSMSGAYEREAVRPYVLGRFQDMLAAVESHPAMLFYLDNTVSIGPNSVAGINRTRGLNENLAREILELHTLGVRSVYTQEDVVRFANVLTGWTLLPAADNPDHGGEFVFNRRLHEPGAQTILGKVYSEGGVEQGKAVLNDLAGHPATAKHVAGKLARYFVADQPPPTLVESLARTFQDTAGDLKEVAKALVASDEAWSLPPSKLKRPSEWVTAMVRAGGGTTADPRRFTAGQATLGEPLWRPPSPKGYADDEASWIDGMGQRLDIAHTYAERVAGALDPRFVIDSVLEATLSATTTEAVARAESRQQALALLFMSPEFQRR